MKNVKKLLALVALFLSASPVLADSGDFYWDSCMNGYSLGHMGFGDPILGIMAIGLVFLVLLVLFNKRDRK